MKMVFPLSQQLGAFLKERRQSLDARALGYLSQRRRTLGLRREEVAQRASISVTWYTWLEQGRGGAPSVPVLERLSQALLLTDTEREHLFLLGVGHPPQTKHQENQVIPTHLQHVLNTLNPCPALIKNLTWDVLAWNDAARLVLTDYTRLEPEQRNILRLIFSHEPVRQHQADWEAVARMVVGAFRADIARVGESQRIQNLVQELSAKSAFFATLWETHNVQDLSEGIKYLHRSDCGTLALNYSSFGIHARPDLSLLVYSPATDEDASKIATIFSGAHKAI